MPSSRKLAAKIFFAAVHCCGRNVSAEISHLSKIGRLNPFLQLLPELQQRFAEDIFLILFRGSDGAEFYANRLFDKWLNLRREKSLQKNFPFFRILCI